MYTNLLKYVLFERWQYGGNAIIIQMNVCDTIQFIPVHAAIYLSVDHSTVYVELWVFGNVTHLKCSEVEILQCCCNVTAKKYKFHTML